MFVYREHKAISRSNEKIKDKYNESILIPFLVSSYQSCMTLVFHKSLHAQWDNTSKKGPFLAHTGLRQSFGNVKAAKIAKIEITIAEGTETCG